MDHGPPEPADVRLISPKKKGDGNLHDLTAPDRLLNWKLDWKAYFHRFCEDHGGNPVEIGGRLVLPDGWSYSATDYRGPEWEPPIDPKAKAELLTKYWTERAGIVRDELKRLTHARQGLKEQLVERSAPLMRKTRRQDETTRRWVSGAEEVSIEPLDVRIEWLSADLEFCRERLTALKEGAT